jgi:methylenetetrahydrofolate reductase (NADPH)
MKDDKTMSSTQDQAEFSFELFPTAKPAQAEMLGRTVARLSGFKPAFFSLTYGAGGSEQARSLQALDVIRQACADPVAAHLTCVGSSRDDVRKTIETFQEKGIEQFVALRGDPPEGVGASYVAHPQGYSDTAELVADLHKLGARDISVSAYPERHPHSPDWDHEMAVLKRKADAGANRAITQFFFDNDDFENFCDRAQAAGITLPIVPGILPIHNFPKVRQFAQRCGAGIPASLAQQFENVEPGTELHGLIAAAIAMEQVQDLKRRGVRQFHFYTMNLAGLTEAICRSALSCTSAGLAAA